MKLLTNLNLEHNELQNALMHPLSSAPAEGQKGQLYYNNVEDRLYEHNGTAWVGIAKMTDLDGYVPSTRTVNGKPLTEDIKLTGEDIGVSSGATSQTVTLLASGWTDNGDGRYVQTVAVAGITVDSNGFAFLAQEANANQRDAARNAALHLNKQANNSVTIVADNTVPAVDIPMTIVAF